MKERIQGIPARVVEFWNKYTSKQKTIIISVLCVVLVLVGLAAYLVSRPTWSKFQEFSNLEDASAMSSALESDGIASKSSRDGLTLYVHDSDMTEAFYCMSDNNLTDKGYTWDEAFDNSISTTESEKSQKRILALQSELKNSIVKYSFIDDADVFIDVPESSYSILEDDSETSVTARVEVNEKNADQLTSDTAQNLAYWLANAVGTDVDHVIINDSTGSCLYNGFTSDGLGGDLTGGSTEYCEKLRNTIASNITDLLVKCGYDDVQVGTQGIQFNMNKVETLTKTYSVADGREYGYPTNYYHYENEGNSGTAAGIPGTDSNDNDETDYVLDTGDSSSSSLEIEKLTDLLTDETIENIKQEKPAIELDSSSLGIVVTRYIVYDEEQLEADGSLDNMTFDEFMAANNTRNTFTVSDEELQLLASASGVDQGSITVVGYEVPKFVEKTSTGRSISDYLMILLAILIIALLIFVVIRGTAPVTVEEAEPELSVEQLLATTKENQSLEDIEFSDKSETRKMIEKFVDENPEAVAQLLRNWITDDWE
jgi:flagellar M-ring protein FliF